MKNLFVSAALALTIYSCQNSPEGSTNQEGSGASMDPKKTGDTSGIKDADSGGGGEYNTDTMPGTINKRIKDSTQSLTMQDSIQLKMISGTKPLPETSKQKQPAAKTRKTQ